MAHATVEIIGEGNYHIIGNERDGYRIFKEHTRQDKKVLRPVVNQTRLKQIKEILGEAQAVERSRQNKKIIITL